jgi:hypothetical protein
MPQYQGKKRIINSIKAYLYGVNLLCKEYYENPSMSIIFMKILENLRKNFIEIYQNYQNRILKFQSTATL